MSGHDADRAALSRLVGRWRGRLLHGLAGDQESEELPGTCESRWVLGGRFVEMTLRAGSGGDAWSALLYIGHQQHERRHVLVSLGPGSRQAATTLGVWSPEGNHFVLTSARSRAVCGVSDNGAMTLDIEDSSPGCARVSFTGDCHRADPPPHRRTPGHQGQRRFVIA